ncbi:MAG: pyridoxal phosphate-dependent transferase [Benniella sp.]|nr:MAG: pyridoxal phosphate-dependent transferase [Benniella sp.]
MASSNSVNPLPYSDFRSDTSTAPTPEMFAAMMKASLGDDVFSEDDSVKKLEQYVATLCGHEAALFCASGTMSNQLAHRVHLCNPPQSALVDIRSHVFNYEAGGISFHSQAAVYPVMPGNSKYLTVEDIASRLVMDVDVHYAPTRVISLENTLNGTIMPFDEIVRIRQLTQDHDIKLHLDGARLWHASVATGISMKDYCRQFDTVSLCLSKGIGAPIGSILVGSEAIIKKARHFRLLFGGGWRQAGILAEAALWGIKTNWPIMDETHRRAKWLERAFLMVGCQITNPVDTNMIWVDTTQAGFTVDELMAALAKEKIKISGSGNATRVVLHYQITNEAVERFMDVLRELASTSRMKINVDLVKASMIEQPESIMEQQMERKVEMEDVQETMALDATAPDASLTPISPDCPLADAQVPMRPTMTDGQSISGEEEEESEDEGEEDRVRGIMRRHTYYDMSNLESFQERQCLFEESGRPTLTIPRKIQRARANGTGQGQGQEQEEVQGQRQIVHAGAKHDNGRQTRFRPRSEHEGEQQQQQQQQPMVRKKSNWLNKVATEQGHNKNKHEHSFKQRENECMREPQPHKNRDVDDILYNDDDEVEQDEAEDVTIIPRASRRMSLPSRHRRTHSLPLGPEHSPLVNKRKLTFGYRIAQSPASKALKRASTRIARWSGSLLTRES